MRSSRSVLGPWSVSATEAQDGWCRLGPLADRPAPLISFSRPPERHISHDSCLHARAPYPSAISHTILACTPQGGGRNECGGNSTSNIPVSHSRDARRKAATKSLYRRTASIQSCLVEACALGRGVCLVLMGLLCGFCSVMCFVFPAVPFGAPASIPATSCATRRLRSSAVKAAQHGSGTSWSVSVSLGHPSENRSTFTSSSTSIFQRLVQLRHRCTDALPPSRSAWTQLSPGHC